MAAFKVFLRKTGETGVEAEVMPETLMSDLKVRRDLVGYTMSYKGHLKNATRMADLGIKAGETISAVKTRQTPVRQVELRLKTGHIIWTTAHSHLNLHVQTQAMVVSAVMEESELNRKTTKEESASIHKVLGNLTAIAQGDMSARALDQHVRERRNQLRTQTRAIQNELADLGAKIKVDDEKKKEEREKVAQKRHRTKKGACGG